MDERFLRLYRQELVHLREMGAEFAREFPKIAGRLGMEDLDCADPYVERLLEGFAFLTARIQLKMEAEYPRFTQHIFEKTYPQYLCPIPSLAIVQFQPTLSEGSLDQGPVVPRGSIIRSELGPQDQTRCAFTTAHDVSLWPLEITEAVYHTRDISSLDLPDTRGAKAALRLRLRATAGLKISDIQLDRLVIHIRGVEGLDMRIYEQLMTHVTGVVVHARERPPGWVRELPAASVREFGFTDRQAMLPVCAQSFQGYRLLQEYFCLPERFLFFELTGLKDAISPCEAPEIDITILLAQTDVELDGIVNKENFKLGCTPVANLFERRLDRIHLSDKTFEYQLIPDRTAPLDYELHSVIEVTGYSAREEVGEQTFKSFYSTRDVDMDTSPCFYALHRVPRVLSERERLGKRRSTQYVGNEAYISLVDTNAAPFRSDMRQLGVVALCTNRDLAVRIPVGQSATDFTLDIGLPIDSIRVLGAITPPKPSRAEGEHAWRLISHLTPNYLSILDTEGGDAGAALREILGLYTDLALPEMRRQIEGIRSVSGQPILRRLHEGGPIAFARGIEITVTVDELAFEGSGVFLLGSVLNQFFTRYVTINVFTELVLSSMQRGVVKRWPVMTGRQKNL